MMRQLETELEDAYGEADLESAKPGRLLAPVGVDIAPFMKSLMRRFPIPGVEIEVVPVENGFFGPNVTVTGLLTGGDLIRGLAGKSADRVLVTECMLRDQEDVFLDDLTLGEVQEKVGIPFVKVGRRGDELLDAMMNRD